MAKDKKPTFIGDKTGSSGSVVRDKVNVMFSDNEVKELDSETARMKMRDRSEYIRYRCFDQPKTETALSASEAENQDQISPELMREAFLSIIHLHSLFKDKYIEAGQITKFDELHEVMLERLRRSGSTD
jgi:hypothetical protein